MYTIWFIINWYMMRLYTQRFEDEIPILENIALVLFMDSNFRIVLYQSTVSSSLPMPSGWGHESMGNPWHLHEDGHVKNVCLDRGLPCYEVVVDEQQDMWPRMRKMRRCDKCNKLELWQIYWSALEQPGWRWWEVCLTIISEIRGKESLHNNKKRLESRQKS